eukprot:evm.model.NODE_27998_length_27464_cov_27.523705.8
MEFFTRRYDQLMRHGGQFVQGLQVQLAGADNTLLKTTGAVELVLEIGPRKFRHRFIVIDGLKHDVILGCDFLRATRATINFGNSSLTIEHQAHTFEVDAEDLVAGIHLAPDLDDRLFFNEKEDTIPAPARDSQPNAALEDSRAYSTDGEWIEVDLSESELSSHEKRIYTEMIRTHYRAFAPNPEFPGKTDLVKLTIDTGANPPIAIPPRRHPYAHDEFVKQKLDSLQRAGIIRESNSPWAAPIVIVMQKGKARFAIDYRELNKILRNSETHYPITLIDSCSQALIFIRTYVAESVRFPTSTTAKPGFTPEDAIMALHSSLISPRITSAIALPSMMLSEEGAVIVKSNSMSKGRRGVESSSR